MQVDFGPEFEALRTLGSDKFTLRGPTILVEMLQQEELKTKGGLIISTPSDHKMGSVNAHKLEYGVVLLVGQGTWDELKREYVPLDVKPGQIVVMPQYSQQVLSTFPGLQRPLQNKLALVSAQSILGLYRDGEAFEEAKKAINARVE